MLIELIKKNWKAILGLLLVLLFSFSIGYLVFTNSRLENKLEAIQNQQALAAEQVKTQNEKLEKLSVTLKSDIAQGFLENKEAKDAQIKDLQAAIDKSSAQSNSLYKTLNSKVSGLSNTTSNETLLRYVDVLNKSYRETNDAYGEAGESLERARIELQKCNSDINTVYKSVGDYNEKLNSN